MTKVFKRYIEEAAEMLENPSCYMDVTMRGMAKRLRRKLREHEDKEK